MAGGGEAGEELAGPRLGRVRRDGGQHGAGHQPAVDGVVGRGRRLGVAEPEQVGVAPAGVGRGRQHVLDELRHRAVVVPGADRAAEPAAPAAQPLDEAREQEQVTARPGNSRQRRQGGAAGEVVVARRGQRQSEQHRLRAGRGGGGRGEDLGDDPKAVDGQRRADRTGPGRGGGHGTGRNGVDAAEDQVAPQRLPGVERGKRDGGDRTGPRRGGREPVRSEGTRQSDSRSASRAREPPGSEGT